MSHGLPQWARGPSVIDPGDQQSLSDSSPSRSTAAFAEAGPAPPSLQSSDPYYALDSSGARDRSKKRKIERACDFCRRRKTKCDGPKMRGFTCTNCAQNGRQCTYNEASKPRGPPKAYVNSLEDRFEKVEALLKRLRPEIYFSRELGPPIVRGSWRNEFPPPPKSAVHAPLIPRLPTTSSLQSNSLIPPAPLLASGAGPNVAGGPVTISLSNSLPTPISARPSRDNLKAPTQAFSDYEEVSSGSSSEGEDYGELSLVRDLQGLSLGTTPKPLEAPDLRAVPDSQWRFHGKSSSFKLISAARKYQQRHMDEMAKTHPETKSSAGSPQALGTHTTRRDQFWNSPSWETNSGESGPKFSGSLKGEWPDMDLAERLIDGYFAVMNAHFPLLHRPTFSRQWKDRLYERDGWFACLCMSLFAVASRWCHDPRVLRLDMMDPTKPPPEESDPIWNSAGWKYIAVAIEFQSASHSVILPPSLFEVQTYHNIGLFLRGTRVYTDAWTFVSIGLRKAQDIGAHRKSVYGQVPTVEGELWKRAYWLLVSFDAISSMILGRPCASRDEDFDLDMPLEVDDEYWESDDLSRAFQQPPGKPSLVGAFIGWVKLARIAAHALRTLYALEKSQAPLGFVGPRWREETVQRLNEAMGGWIEDLPEHLKWNPEIKDPVFASQAATLITTYYMVQIVAHRPFIPMPTALTLGGFNRKHNLAVRPEFPWNCLAVCTNAAMATSGIVESYAQSVKNKNIASMANCCYVAAGVLLVNLWIIKAMQKAKVPLDGGALKKISAERVKDVTDTLTKLMTRLEELAPKMEVAAMWLGEIQESLPTHELSDSPSPEGEKPEFEQETPLKEEDQTSEPVMGARQYQYSPMQGSDTPPLTVLSNPLKICYDFVQPSTSHAQPLTPLTPSRLYDTSSPTSSTASPYATQHQWESSERSDARVQESGLPTPPVLPTPDLTPVLRQGYIRHDGMYGNSIVNPDNGLLSSGQETTPVPLPPWVAFQGTSLNPMSRAQQQQSYTPVKPEEDPGVVSRGAFVATPTILPPFYAPASGDPAFQQSPPGSSPTYGQSWEYRGYRSPDRMQTWRDEVSQGKHAAMVPTTPFRSTSNSHPRPTIVPSTATELRSVGYETLYTPMEARQQQQTQTYHQPSRQY